MTDPERQALLETAVASYFRGSIDTLDLLEKAIALAPNHSVQLPISVFIETIAACRALVIAKSQIKDVDLEAMMKEMSGPHDS